MSDHGYMRHIVRRLMASIKFIAKDTVITPVGGLQCLHTFMTAVWRSCSFADCTDPRSGDSTPFCALNHRHNSVLLVGVPRSRAEYIYS